MARKSKGNLVTEVLCQGDVAKSVALIPGEQEDWICIVDGVDILRRVLSLDLDLQSIDGVNYDDPTRTLLITLQKSKCGLDNGALRCRPVPRGEKT